MAEMNRQFEVRQLLKAYRKGLISDELFEEQMCEIEGRTPAAASGKTYCLRDKIFHSERELLVHFLDEFRAGETFGGEVFALWRDATQNPMLRAGLRVITERESRHGWQLGERLAELGGKAEVTLPAPFREAACARLGSRDISDVEKLGDVLKRLPDAESAVKPICDVICQIETDCETRALLELIVDEEASTVRWLHAACRALSGDSSRPAAEASAANGASATMAS